MRDSSRSNHWLTATLLTPASLWFVFMLIFPLIVILVFSFGERAAVGGYAGGFTLEQYANLPSRLKAFQNTMLIAPAGTLLSLMVAYPLAYFLAIRVSRRYKLILLVLVIVPFWTSLLVRTYAW
ncbi:MAG: ABC transporter permease, partial [Aestuariibacter sp.]|nr:ABC transporter permease [Aestuariibacter sp.]